MMISRRQLGAPGRAAIRIILLLCALRPTFSAAGGTAASGHADAGRIATYYLVAQGNDGGDVCSGWRRVESAGALQSLAESGKVFMTATVRTEDGAPIAVEIMSQPPSGDWLMVTTSEYRMDGSLRRVRAVLNTTHGTLRVITTRTYSRGGDLLGETVQYRDLRSNRQVKPRPFEAVEPTVVRQASKLPFRALLP